MSGTVLSREWNKLTQLRLVVLDVDGVLTDGSKHYNQHGIAGLTFHVRDGLGIYLLQGAGLMVAWVTNDRNGIIQCRAKDLGVSELLQGVDDKSAAVRHLKSSFGFTTDETLYMGDDLWDLPAFEEAAVRVAVADASLRVRAAANWITSAKGGGGAVREVADAILNAMNIDSAHLLRKK